MTVTRRTVLTAISAAAAAAAQAQRNRPPNWKPRLGVLMQYSDSNLEFVKAEGFTSAQLRLDPDQVDDAAIAAIKDNIAKSGIYISSLAVDGNHIDPDPAKRDRQNAYTVKCLDLCGKLGIPNIGGQSGTIPNMPLDAAGGRDRQGLHREILRCLREEQSAHSVGALRRRAQHRHRTGGLGSALQSLPRQPARGPAVRPVAPGVAVHGPGGGGARIRRQDLRRPPERHGDSLARAETRRHPAREPCPLVAFPRARIRLGGLEGLLLRCSPKSATPER